VTKTEQAILDLWKSMSKLEERVESARSDIKDAESEIKGVDERRLKATEALSDLDRRLSVIEDNIKELRRTAEERGRRQWTIILAVIGCLLTLAANLGLAYFRWNK
jgi:predicted  nucleic acid-binding Zn-ribbon protein